MLHLDIKFLHLLSVQFDKFKQKDNINNICFYLFKIIMIITYSLPMNSIINPNFLTVS